VETALDVVTDTNTFTAYPPCLPFTMYGVPRGSGGDNSERVDRFWHPERIHFNNRDISVSGKTSWFAPSCRTSKPPANLQLSRVQSIRAQVV